MTVKIVNVILHGVFGYVFKQDCILAYTPAVWGHMYNAGERDFRKNENNGRRLGPTDYELKGVETNETSCEKPDAKKNPILDEAETKLVIDPYGKRYTAITLPYPDDVRKIWPLENYLLGEVYSGAAASPLNQLDWCPSLQAIVYRLNGDTLSLVPSDAGDPTITFELQPNIGNEDTENLHIYCTLDPRYIIDWSTKGMTEEGHLRRAFAALVDLFCPLELTLQIPNRFAPAEPEPKPPLPRGVTDEDVDPDPGDFERLPAPFGHINCHYSNLMLWRG